MPPSTCMASISAPSSPQPCAPGPSCPPPQPLPPQPLSAIPTSAPAIRINFPPFSSLLFTQGSGSESSVKSSPISWLEPIPPTLDSPSLAHTFVFFKFKIIYLRIWLHWVLVAAHWIIVPSRAILHCDA